MIDERLLARAAAETGTTPEAYLETALAALPPIDESDLQALFDANKDRLPADATIDPYREQLRDHLREQRIHEVYARLREDASIRVTLPRERVAVAATGPSLGPAEAPVTIVEFSDFQCPFCGRAVSVVEALHARYPDTVRIVYRHLPLSFHEHARLAAIASVCADEQGRFWDYHDRLFDDQKALAREDLIAHAEALGLDRRAFEACLVAPEPAAVVDADLSAAEEVGATGTPTFFVNGLKLTGARPVEQFEEIIDEELQRVAR
jgi:protein-disulfide isomerase